MAHAQSSKNSTAFKAAFSSIAELASKSSIQIKSERKKIIYGTAVDADGYVITKASAIANREIVCVVDGTEYKPDVVATDSKSDMALLKLPVKLTPVKFDIQSRPKSGQFVVSIGDGDDIAAVGIVSVDRQNLGNGRQWARNNKKPEGTQSDATGKLVGFQSKVNIKGDGLIVETIEDKSLAQASGLLAKDILLTFNGKKITSQFGLRRLASALKPGEKVKLGIDRRGTPLEISMQLGKGEPRRRSSSRNSSIDKWGGGSFSDVRFNLGSVIAHDSVINPRECGTPLFNSDGKAIGVNIARSLRVTTYAIPASRVVAFVDANKARTTTNR